MRATIIYKSNTRRPDEWSRGVESVSFCANSGRALVKIGGDELTLEGVETVHVYEEEH